MLLFTFLLAMVQPKLAGTWTLVSVVNIRADGTRVEPYGEHPAGLLVLDAEGRYSIQIYRDGRPKFAANDKNRGTDDEYRAAVQGCNTHIGRYRVDGDVLTFRIEHASFPNWEGTEQKRTFSFDGDTLTYVVRTPTNGGAETAEVSWRRTMPRSTP
jgi:hypothetical protein